MKFTKMQGIGNDYIYVYQIEGQDLAQVSRALSPRRFSVGSDGLIHLFPSTLGDFTMEMYNADGSVGAMCGNGIRCAGKFLYEGGYTQKTQLLIETASGLRQIFLSLSPQNQVEQVTVAMGEASGLRAEAFDLGGKGIQGHFVSLGNPHFVVMCQDPQEIELCQLGQAIASQEIFGEDGVNVEFYCPTEAGFSLRVWERGSGETLACGTGACACFAVGQALGVLDAGQLQATLPGGTLDLWQDQGQIFLRGKAVQVYEGEVDLGEISANLNHNNPA